jgi:hypothetical protein
VEKSIREEKKHVERTEQNEDGLYRPLAHHQIIQMELIKNKQLASKSLYITHFTLLVSCLVLITSILIV